MQKKIPPCLHLESPKDKELSAPKNDNDKEDEELAHIAAGMDDKVSREQNNIDEFGIMIPVDKIIDYFVDSAFSAMNPNEVAEKINVMNES